MKNLMIVIGFAFFMLFSNTGISLAISEDLTDTASPTPAPTSKPINYTLAYPGILPDDPLYKLKVLRDKITEKLISDPAKKIDYYLLQTDKQILAASMLVEKNKLDIAKETALKGENNYTMLVMEYKILGTKPDKNMFEKLQKAAMKHQEVLKYIINKVDKKDKQTFNNVLYFSQVNQKELEKIYNKKSN